MEFDRNILTNGEDNSSSSYSIINHIVIQRIFKYTAFIIGIVLFFMISFDLGEKILNTYTEQTLNDHMRILEDILGGISDKRMLFKNGSDLDLLEKELNESLKEYDNVNNMIKNNEVISIMETFYDQISQHTYKGIWKSKNQISYFDNITEGEMALKVQKVVSMNNIYPETIYIIFRLLDGKYIDKWIFGKSFSILQANVTIMNHSITFDYITYIDYGEIFEKTNSAPRNIII
jgi:hypothetical protein